MAIPQFTGSVSVPSLGQFSSSTSVPATFAGAIQTGPNPYSFVSIGDINATRTPSSGLAILGGGTERGVLDFGITNAHATTISGIGGSSTGNLNVTGSVSAGSGNSPATLLSGDIGASRSATTGAVKIGGSSSSATIDFGLTTPSIISINAPIATGSNAIATNGGLNLMNTTTGGGQTGSTVYLARDGGGTQGLNINVPTGSTNGVRFLVNAATPIAQVAVTGQITPGNGSGGIGTAAIYSGTGSPSGSLSAPNGSLFIRFDGGASTRLYINTTGASSSGTTWTAITEP